MGRRKRRKEAKALAAASRPRKKRRLRKLLVLGSVAGGIAAWRQRQLTENESKFSSAS
jgi:hypothetical protein